MKHFVHVGISRSRRLTKSKRGLMKRDASLIAAISGAEVDVASI